MFLLPADNVFGCHLATLCAQERTTVPSFVEKCIKAVEKRGNTPGLYESQNHTQVFYILQQLTNSYDVLICRFRY